MAISLLVAYSVDGIDYREPVTRLFPRTNDSDYKNLFREGGQISLRYDPADPSSFSTAPLMPD